MAFNRNDGDRKHKALAEVRRVKSPRRCAREQLPVVKALEEAAARDAAKLAQAEKDAEIRKSCSTRDGLIAAGLIKPS